MYGCFLFVKSKSPPSNDYTTTFENACTGPHSRHICCLTRRTCQQCDTAGMSAMWHSRHVCRVTHQTRQLCDTADMSAA